MTRGLKMKNIVHAAIVNRYSLSGVMAQFWFGLACVVALLLSSGVNAQSHPIGSGECGEECHEAEFEVWDASPHQVAFYKFDDPSDELTEKVDSILAAVGDDDMTESTTCTICHFTNVQDAPDEDAYADSGPSCESCHGAGSEFRDIHSEQDDDFDTRMAKSESLGMTRPHMKFDIAMNCNGCHAMAREEINGEQITAMLDAGHPINPDFELVQYSQGSVKHRFYEPDTSVNADMSQAELAHLYVEGQVAQLLAAHQSLNKSSQADYAGAMKQRVASAKKALANVAGADAFTGSPSEQSARALIKQLEGKDLTGSVGSMLPDASSYKMSE